ncbi:MAG: DNA adenine methylase [Bacteroidales bacterium]|nr:DNA adenine methylase [Bacteroidales bacterium]
MLDTIASVGNILKDIRETNNFSLQDVTRVTHIDYTLLSRIETGKRLPTKEQIKRLAIFYKYDENELIKHLISDKIIYEIKDEEFGMEAIQLAERKIRYGQSLFPEYEIQEKIKLESRRYIGNKAKLTSWIMDIIQEETENVESFIDIFAGTAIISQSALKKYNKVIINDLLYSNNVIYKAFFEKGIWDKEKLEDFIHKYNSTNSNLINENYFSENFGNKFFEQNIAKKIGFIRQDIKKERDNLTEKEYNILLATLIYNMDKVTNTVGHFDAYIKKPIRKRQFQLKLIEINDFENVEIHREDANLLSKKIKADIAYVDPPYNSRQYSRFYHIYETLIKWNKPKLFGVALKPEPENMSKYCTVKAKDSFKELIKNLDVKYLAVSYNNTYKSKSKSSENKIKLEEITEILNEVGETSIFEQSHKFFNTGKTDFSDHKEFLFLTKKYE